MAVIKTSTRPPTTVKGLKALLSYVLRDEKTEEKLIDALGDIHDFEFGYTYDKDRMYKEFRRVHQEYHKTTGRLCAHYIQSFPPGEVTAVEAHAIGIEFAERIWPEHQVLVVTHVDRKHLHNHFVINAVAFTDGHKIHTSKQDLEHIKGINDDICREHQLSVPTKGMHVDGTEIQPGELITESRPLRNLIMDGRDSYIADCASCIQEILPASTSKEDFCDQMQQHGWTVRWTDDRKHVTFVDSAGHRVRDSKISKSFNLAISKDDLEKAFRQNDRTRVARQEEGQAERRQQRHHRR